MSPLEVYLGGIVEKKVINEHEVWALCSLNYIKVTIKTITEVVERGVFVCIINQIHSCMQSISLNWIHLMNWKGVTLHFTRK